MSRAEAFGVSTRVLRLMLRLLALEAIICFMPMAVMVSGSTPKAQGFGLDPLRALQRQIGIT